MSIHAALNHVTHYKYDRLAVQRCRSSAAFVTTAGRVDRYRSGALCLCDKVALLLVTRCSCKIACN